MRNGYVVVSGTLFGVIAVVQALRAWSHWPAHIGGFEVPVWVSWLVAVGAGSLCAWAFRSRQQ